MKFKTDRREVDGSQNWTAGCVEKNFHFILVFGILIQFNILRYLAYTS